MEEAENTEAEAPKKGGKKKKLLIVLVLLLLLGGGGAGVFFSGILNKKPADGAAAAGADAPVATAAVAPADNSADVFHDLPDILVNLDGNGKQAHFLKMKVSLELGNKADEAAIDKVMPRVIDQFQTYLRELRPEDLKGSEGIYRLRQELLTRVAASNQPIIVKDVLFREVLIQ